MMDLTPRVIRGDAKALPLDDASVHCVVTSPPYWGLRQYGGDAGMIGLEPTLDDHLDNLVEVFREVWRVLRDDGTLWLNYGDAYAANGTTGGGSPVDFRKAEYGRNGPAADKVRGRDPQKKATPHGLKPKDLMLLPARVAMALQADGWWVRSEIVWAKPNPMPESVTDRPTSAHEKVFLLSKRARYFYDADAVRQPNTESVVLRMRYKKDNQRGRRVYSEDETDRGITGYDARTHGPGIEPSGANLRNVWSIPTQGYSGAHFATFPLALAKRCIMAGTSEKGVCADCGAPWEREVEKATGGVDWINKAENVSQIRGGQMEYRNYRRGITTGWHPTCDCACRPAPAMVFDPFGGSGTVGVAAEQLGRRSILNEINADYCTMARDRINQQQPMMALAG